MVHWKGPSESAGEDQGEHFDEAIEVLEGSWKRDVVPDEFIDVVDVTFCAPVHVTLLILRLVKPRTKVASKPPKNWLIDSIEFYRLGKRKILILLSL